MRDELGSDTEQTWLAADSAAHDGAVRVLGPGAGGCLRRAGRPRPAESGIAVNKLKTEAEGVIREDRATLKRQRAELGPDEPEALEIQPGLSIKAGQAAAVTPVKIPEDPYGD
jgi:hypothetical protein